MAGNPSASPEESKWKARTLDRIDAAMNPAKQVAANQGQPQQGNQQGQQQGKQSGQNQPGQQSGQGQQSQAQQAAQEAMQNAQQAQQAQMAQSRQGGKVPGQKQQQSQEGNGAGAPMVAQDEELMNGELPDMPYLDDDAWARLPPKVAEALASPKEDLDGEYRAMVETYFKVIAKKASEGK